MRSSGKGSEAPKKDIAADDHILTKKDIRAAAWRYVFWHQSGQNYERMQGLAFGHILAKPLRKLYKDDEEYRQALVRHVQYYNSNPTLGGIVPGVTLALEEGRAMGEPVDVDLIIGTKNALMGPLAGIGDPLISSVYCSIAASLAISLTTSTNSLIGPAMYLVLNTGVLVLLKWLCVVKGYEFGSKAVSVLTGSFTHVLTIALSIVGTITIGGITSSIVKIPITYEYVSGESVISAADMLSKIMPGLLPFLMTILVWYLYSKRGWSTSKALILVICLCFVCVLCGIM